MLTFVIRRVLQSIPLLLLISMILFGIISKAPGGPLTPYLQNPHITEADIASGAINHAVGIVLPRCNFSVYPADRGDCGNDPGQPAEGQWFRFAPGTQMPSRLTPFAQMVFQAIETYGAVVTDQGGAVSIEAEQPSDWAAEGHSGADPITASWEGLQEYQVVASLPWSDLQVVDPPHS